MYPFKGNLLYFLALWSVISLFVGGIALPFLVVPLLPGVLLQGLFLFIWFTFFMSVLLFKLG